MSTTLSFPLIGIAIDRSIRPARYTLLALLMALVILVSGFACNVQTWVNNVNTILQEVGPAVQIVVSVLPLLGTSVPPTVTSAVNTWAPKLQSDVTQLGSLIQQLQGDLATNPTTQAKINALIATTQQDVLSILPVFQVLDPSSQAKVVAAVNIISAAITSVENIVNNVEGKVTFKATNNKMIKNGSDFKKQFNATLQQNFGPAAPKLN
jgi:hypothetical protein